MIEWTLQGLQTEIWIACPEIYSARRIDENSD